MTHWLDIIGVPEAGITSLSPDLQALIARAETVIGVKRRLEGLTGEGRKLITWDGALNEMVDKIMAAKHGPTVLLASGDPNWFGIGATLSHRLLPEDFAIHPAPSSFQLAAARLHWPMQEIATLSLHGRDIALVQPHVLPGNRVLALTTNAETPTRVAALLMARGYGRSRLTVLESLGGDDEKISAFSAAEAADRPVGPFHVLAIECVADAGALLLPPVPGLPDAAFESDGQLTKREVRAATLAKLSPSPGALLWDIGAGSGSVAIEWMRAARGARAIAFERDAERSARIARNAETLGVPGLKIVCGEAPQTLDGQERPDALFLGGDVGNPELFEAAFAALKPGGRLVANAVTLSGETALLAYYARYGGDITRIGVEALDMIGGEAAFRPRMRVTQYALTKGGK